MRARLTATVFLLLAATCACSSSTAPAATAGGVSSAVQPTATAPALPESDQASLSALFKAANLPAVKFTTYTADTDPNHKLGRPGGYSAFVCWVDSRIDATDPHATGAQAGGCVETWPGQSAAQGRANYIQSALKAMPMLGSEYDYARSDGELLRVSGLLTPTQAQAYRAAFRA